MRILRQTLGSTSAPLQPALLSQPRRRDGRRNFLLPLTVKPLRLPFFLGMPFWPYPGCKDIPVTGDHFWISGVSGSGTLEVSFQRGDVSFQTTEN